MSNSCIKILENIQQILIENPEFSSLLSGSETVIDRFGMADVLKHLNKDYDVKFCWDLFRISRGKYSFKNLHECLEYPDLVEEKLKPVINNCITTTTSTKKEEKKGQEDFDKEIIIMKETIPDKNNTIEMKMTTTPTFCPSLFVPRKKEDYVSFGFTIPLTKILKSDLFFPVYITGPSGTGKNIGIEQVCATLKKPMIHTPITEETSEEDLIGCWTLINGNTVWRDGPVVTCARHGMVSVLDEIDLATPKIMCLQSILNGDPIYINATGEKLFPKKGFNIIATGNTKGLGESDVYVGTQTLNEAFLERFKITFEHLFPTDSILQKIVSKKMSCLNLNSEKDILYGTKLVSFVSHISNAYTSGAVQYYISNRRLAFILETYALFGDKIKSLAYTLGRFPKEIGEAFISLYVKMDEGIEISVEDFIKELSKSSGEELVIDNDEEEENDEDL